MEKVFEDYVAGQLKRSFPEYHVSAQVSGKSLVVDHQGKSMFNMRPDLQIKKGNDIICIADTKWKLIDQADSSDKYGISQADMYQLFAYAKKYSSQRVVLIYPQTDQFSRPLASFKFDHEFELFVVPFPFNTSLEKQGKDVIRSMLDGIDMH